MSCDHECQSYRLVLETDLATSYNDLDNAQGKIVKRCKCGYIHEVFREIWIDDQVIVPCSEITKAAEYYARHIVAGGQP